MSMIVDKVNEVYKNYRINLQKFDKEFVIELKWPLLDPRNKCKLIIRSHLKYW
jgi:hypothetical protein